MPFAAFKGSRGMGGEGRTDSDRRMAEAVTYSSIVCSLCLGSCRVFLVVAPIGRRLFCHPERRRNPRRLPSHHP